MAAFAPTHPGCAGTHPVPVGGRSESLSMAKPLLSTEPGTCCSGATGDKAGFFTIL